MDYLISRYASAAELLPARLRAAAMALSDGEKAAAEEFRLRLGRRPSVLLPNGERALDAAAVSAEELNQTAARAARGSLHSVADELRLGFITAPGGHRLGVCGRAATEGGECRLIRDFSSLNLRIAKEILGAADGIFEAVCLPDPRSTLILSPPGGGKTTLLRDLARQAGNAGFRVAIADERGEIAACSSGRPGFDLGECCDVLTGAPKSFAALVLLRAMNPQVLALDEITDPADFEAVARADGCGAAVFATVHADSVESARRRLGGVFSVFEMAVLITRDGSERRVEAVELERR